MFTIPAPFDIAFVVAALAAILIGIRRVAGGEPVDLGALFTNRVTAMPWPRGVQEEEPRPWRVEILDRRGAARSMALPRQAQPVATPARHAPADCLPG